MEPENRIIVFLHIPILVLTNAVSITLLSLLNRRFTGSFAGLVVHHRTVIAVIVQIAATLLAASQVYVVCTLINFATRLQSVRRFIRASSLSLLAALSVPRIDWSFKWYAVVIAAIFVLVGQLLGAVWAGALTPLVTYSLRDDGTMEIPLYTGPVDKGYSLQPGGSIGLACSTLPWTTSIFISACPAIDYITNLLASAQSATPLQHVPRVYPKIEVPAWSYENRSYGAGASQGLFSPTVNKNHSYTTYTYDEPGYLSQVTCGFNETSNLTIQQLGALEESPLVLWQVDGSLPNTVPTDTSSYTLTTSNTDWYDEVLGWSAAAANGRNIFAIATCAGDIPNPDHWYSVWNTMQCSIDFRPTLFYVLVNLNQSRISVTPKGPYEDFERTGSLQTVIMANLDLLSRMSSNIGVSTLGIALNTNLAAMRARYPNISSEDTLARAAENLISALVDDLLVAEASKQMTINKGSIAKPVQKQFDAVSLGPPRFIYISLAINIALVLLVLAETLRTNAWQHLPAFDFTNLQSVMAAAMLPSSRTYSSLADKDGHYANAALVASQLKHASIKWSHNNTGAVVMLVNLPGVFPRESLRTIENPVNKKLLDGTDTTDIEMKAYSPEHQEPLLNTTIKPASSANL